MKATSSLLATTALLSLMFLSADAAEPKKLLVVTTTMEFRHSSIPTSEKVLEQLGKDSGEFTVEFVHQPPESTVRRPGNNATPEERKAYEDAQAQFKEAMKTALLKLSPENLKNFDGVAFVSTTGQLPIPDPQGLLDWIKAGHAFIGIHAASDTFHRWPAYIDMLGGEFDHHGAQLSVDCLNQDPQNPATAALPKVWTISQEEMYQFKNYNPTNVHDLLILDKKPQPPFTPGHYPVSWCKNYSAGRIFYSSLGHREDIWDTDPSIKDRKNDTEISKSYQKHILGGIEWALKLKDGGKVE